MYNQIKLFSNENNLLYAWQSGFPPIFSTDTMLRFLTDYIRCKIDKGELTGLVLLDLQNAFNVVDHNTSVLLSKLSALGLNLSLVNWFKWYLTQHSHLVEAPLLNLCQWHAKCCQLQTYFICGWFLSFSFWIKCSGYWKYTFAWITKC